MKSLLGSASSAGRPPTPQRARRASNSKGERPGSLSAAREHDGLLEGNFGGQHEGEHEGTRRVAVAAAGPVSGGNQPERAGLLFHAKPEQVGGEFGAIEHLQATVGDGFQEGGGLFPQRGGRRGNRPRPGLAGEDSPLVAAAVVGVGFKRRQQVLALEGVGGQELQVEAGVEVQQVSLDFEEVQPLARRGLPHLDVGQAELARAAAAGRRQHHRRREVARKSTGPRRKRKASRARCRP